jgi:hypothetical protein
MFLANGGYQFEHFVDPPGADFSDLFGDRAGINEHLISSTRQQQLIAFGVASRRGPVRKRTIKRTLSGVWDAEWPESAMPEPLAPPLIVHGQVDVLPAERRQVLQQFGIEDLAVA